MLIGSNRQLNSIFWGHSPVDSISHNPVRHACSFTPFCQCAGNSINCDGSARSCISSLLHTCCPSAVFRGVRAVIVHAVKAVTCRWFASYISKEIFVIVPAFVHYYSTATVMLILRMLGILTTSQHLGPGSIFSGFFPVPPFTMPECRRPAEFSPHVNTETPTRLCGAIEQEPRSNVFNFSTITLTMPNNLASVALASGLNSKKSPESLLSQSSHLSNMARMCLKEQGRVPEN